MDGLHFLSLLPPDSIPVAFFDPQYRGVLDKLSYGNEGKSRGKRRSALLQMSEKIIAKFLQGIDRALIPSGHLFLWMDKFHLCQGFTHWLAGTRLDVVDMIVWDKGRMGMGYRTRRQSEYCIVLQKQPRRAKGVWKLHNIPDVWQEKKPSNGFAHSKPVELQARLIAAVSDEGDMIMDPAAGSFSVMRASLDVGREFLGCDILV
ncbi:MAG: DNA methyltransferase [Chloroflexi bacterium]|nr:DNA methyltransferase [Chloroflexota bacterium]